jgi:23S rRNA pseudouridine1911/1915/1917 synthase
LIDFKHTTNWHEIITAQSGRLDKVLSAQLRLSRNQIEKMIRAGQVTIGGNIIVKPSYKVEWGVSICYHFVEAPKRAELPVDFDVDILYEDEDILVVNKPAGLVVHPAPSVKEPTLVDWLVQRGISLSTLSGEERHGIVHRIDKHTSGALVIAKNNAAHRALSDQLQDKSMGRYYLAVIDQPIKESCSVEAPIARNPKNRLKMAVVEGGRAAKTHFVQLSTSCQQGTSLIAAKLFTGRTHQIRVHLGALSRYILGDNLYGLKSKEGKIGRIYLHAYVLYLIHPTRGDKLEVVAPLSEDMEAYLNQNFDKEILHETIEPDTIRHRFVNDVFDQRVFGSTESRDSRGR